IGLQQFHFHELAENDIGETARLHHGHGRLLSLLQSYRHLSGVLLLAPSAGDTDDDEAVGLFLFWPLWKWSRPFEQLFVFPIFPFQETAVCRDLLPGVQIKSPVPFV